MTSLEEVSRPVPAPSWTGQGTQIEQSRAIAEVQAMVIVAQQVPRDMSRVVRDMNDVCAQRTVAEKAFFRFPRAGQQITGPSIHLARELARVFGNIAFGVTELRRDVNGSEIQTVAWDVQSNTRSATITIVPAMRDKRTGAERLTDLRDIYENNANNGARRLRENIFSVLPDWFIEDAQERCRKTLTDGGGKPLPQRIADAVRVFESIGVTVEQMEDKIGRKAAKWNEFDIAQFTVIYRSIERSETTKEAEFGEHDNRVTVAEVTKPQRQSRGRQQADSSGPPVAEEENLTPDPPVADHPTITHLWTPEEAAAAGIKIEEPPVKDKGK